MKNMNFPKQNKIGKSGENYVLKAFEDCGICCSLIRGKNSYYDMACNFDGLIFFAEIKNDRMATFTKNIAIEFYNTKNGQPSGLSITKADIWIHIVNQQIYMMRTDKLKTVLGQNAPTKIIEGGDNNALIYLYDQALLQLFFLYKNKYELGEYLLCELAQSR